MPQKKLIRVHFEKKDGSVRHELAFRGESIPAVAKFCEGKPKLAAFEKGYTITTVAYWDKEVPDETEIFDINDSHFEHWFDLTFCGLNTP
ncbi:hypothetical protein [Endozoicomonas atrinae]|uniref:hypothetical protein n=1 Tax=Endozoicomonas atrinae TaxID=1333660 RepID=UPI000826A57D|nr:hypothetical protein [Endozoicomonas atrinae]